MKVKCLNNGYSDNLTIGKTYEVINKFICYYDIVNDKNIVFEYPLKWFKPLSEIRNEKIDKLLAE